MKALGIVTIFLLTSGFTCQEAKMIHASQLLKNCPQGEGLPKKSHEDIGEGWTAATAPDLYKKCPRIMMVTLRKNYRENLPLGVEIKKTGEQCSIEVFMAYDERQKDFLSKNMDRLNAEFPKYLKRYGMEVQGPFMHDKIYTPDEIAEWCKQ